MNTSKVIALGRFIKYDTILLIEEPLIQDLWHSMGTEVQREVIADSINKKHNIPKDEICLDYTVTQCIRPKELDKKVVYIVIASFINAKS
jgi:hypothetical protein